MKNIILSLVFLLSALTATAQVASTYFEGKDAFEVFPFLWQMESQSLSAKIMPPFDIDRLLEEDKYLEGLDMPFRFGHGFDVDYTIKDGDSFWFASKFSRSK